MDGSRPSIQGWGPFIHHPAAVRPSTHSPPRTRARCMQACRRVPPVHACVIDASAQPLSRRRPISLAERSAAGRGDRIGPSRSRGEVANTIIPAEDLKPTIPK
jgi:hypothetical protein